MKFVHVAVRPLKSFQVSMGDTTDWEQLFIQHSQHLSALICVSFTLLLHQCSLLFPHIDKVIMTLINSDLMFTVIDDTTWASFKNLQIQIFILKEINAAWDS